MPERTSRMPIEALLQEAWPGVEVGQPEPLTGGFWASMWKVSVTGQPSRVSSPVVVRRAPHIEMGAKEAAVQQAVAEQGYPTPTVWWARPGPDDEGAWWSAMAFAPGAPLLAGLDPATAIRRAPALVRDLPALLADTMAALHRIDPAPVTDAVARVAPGAAWSTAQVVDQLVVGAEAAGRSDLVTALERLADRAPVESDRVVCHGDLHPFNVLADVHETWVLDWTGAVVADPCFDLALTDLLVGNPPLDLPGPLRWVGRAAGRSLSRRLRAAYFAGNPAASPAPLEWYRALHSARAVLDVATLRDTLGPEAGGHPWVRLAPIAADIITEATGTPVHV